ncbi:MAG: TIGR01212 family radical SAM protein [Erysipelotrichaceae bacterium]
MNKKHNYPYSNDNKRYYTFNYYLKSNFNEKVFKVPLNANFSCPNRDGTAGVGGCTFCSALGSGDYAGNIQDDMLTQFAQSEAMMRKKWPNGKAMAYFQAYSNTYADLETLKQHFEPFVQREDVVSIAIATRADCLNDEVIEYLASLCEKKEIWLELGLQSIHDTTSKAINRGHSFATFMDAINRLQATPLKICVHLMNSLPTDTNEMMMETARVVGQLPIHAIKIHMLHVIKNTAMALQYQLRPFSLLSLEEYVALVVAQLEVLRPDIVIQRLTGDAVKEDLIAPLWTLNKTVVLNEIDKYMAAHDTWQGKYYQEKE